MVKLAKPAEATAAARLSRAHTYAADRLGLNLHPKQEAVLRDLFGKKGSRVSFRCGNEVGKTSAIAPAAIFFALEILRAQVISTAGVWMQVSEQLVPCLKHYSHLFPTWRFLESAINVNGVDRYVGFSTRDEGFAQGFHRRSGMPLLAIVDEAAAVKDVVFAGVEDRCNPDYLLVMGSPLDPAGMFYRIETDLSRFYTHHHLSQMECLTTEGYWIDPSSVERKIAKWGKDHPLVLSNVFGEFGQLIAGAILSIGEFESCLGDPPDHHPGQEDRHAFIDFAAGRNKNVFAVRQGNRVWIEKKWTDSNTMATVGECLAIFKRLNRQMGLEPDEIEGDADGLGLPMIQRLREVGLQVGSFHGGAAPRFNREYQNAISEAWGEGAQKIKARDMLIPNDADFKGQIVSRKLRRNSSGRFQLEAKEDMAKRGLDSPDEADAILCAMMPTVAARSVSMISGDKDERGWIERARDESPVGDLPGAFVV